MLGYEWGKGTAYHSPYFWNTLHDLWCGQTETIAGLAEWEEPFCPSYRHLLNVIWILINKLLYLWTLSSVCPVHCTDEEERMWYKMIQNVDVIIIKLGLKTKQKEIVYRWCTACAYGIKVSETGKKNILPTLWVWWWRIHKKTVIAPHLNKHALHTSHTTRIV